MLIPGISGIREPADPAVGAADFEAFLRVLHAAARQIAGTVGDPAPPEVHASYRAVPVSTPGCGSFGVLVSRFAPLVAFSQAADRPPRFATCPQLAAALAAHGHFRVLGLPELAERLTEADLKQLNEVERQLVDRHGAATIGDLVFNRWS